MSTSATNVTTLSSREFNQNRGKAKKAAKHGPVLITDRGTPSYVLLSYVDYAELRERSDGSNADKSFLSVADALSHPASAHIDFEVPRLDYSPRDIDLS